MSSPTFFKNPEHTCSRHLTRLIGKAVPLAENEAVTVTAVGNPHEICGVCGKRARWIVSWTPRRRPGR